MPYLLFQPRWSKCGREMPCISLSFIKGMCDVYLIRQCQVDNQCTSHSFQKSAAPLLVNHSPPTSRQDFHLKTQRSCREIHAFLFHTTKPVSISSLTCGQQWIYWNPLQRTKSHTASKQTSSCHPFPPLQKCRRAGKVIERRLLFGNLTAKLTANTNGYIL